MLLKETETERKYMNGNVSPKKVLMCGPPENFKVHKAYNPKMQKALAESGGENPIISEHANIEWNYLKMTLERLGVEVLVAPQNKNCPDQVFAANAGLVYNGTVILPRFAEESSVRQKEVKFFSRFFKNIGLTIARLPAQVEIEDGICPIYFEGQGEVLYWPAKDMFFIGYGRRSNKEGAHAVAHTLNSLGFEGQIVFLELVDPYFYHLDTCLCAFKDVVFYYPPAFTKASREALHMYVESGWGEVVSLSWHDAVRYLANCVPVYRSLLDIQAKWHLVGPHCPSKSLSDILHNHCVQFHECSALEFDKSGGADACLVLMLEW